MGSGHRLIGAFRLVEAMAPLVVGLRIGIVAVLLAADGPGRVPSAFRFEPSARPELQRLWQASLSAKAERVACLAGAIDGDTVRISRVFPLEVGTSDSLGVSAGASLDICGPPSWRGTVHTHVALRDGRRPTLFFPERIAAS